MSGPPPKHPSARARRNNPRKDFVSLPAAGREGPAPAWPLLPDVELTGARERLLDQVTQLSLELAESGDPKLRRKVESLEMRAAVLKVQLEQAVDAEVQLWEKLWAMPQAVVWEESHADREVAQYVRWKVRAEQGDLKAATEARQLSDRLGLNPLALLRLRLEIERAGEAEDRGRKRRGTPPAPPKPADGDDPRMFLVS